MADIDVISRETRIDDYSFPEEMGARVLESIVLVKNDEDEIQYKDSDSFSTVFKNNIVLNDDELWQ